MPVLPGREQIPKPHLYGLLIRALASGFQPGRELAHRKFVERGRRVHRDGKAGRRSGCGVHQTASLELGER